MTSVEQSVSLVDHTLADMAKWYAKDRVPKGFRDCDPLVLRSVKRLSGGDWRRCVVESPMSVVVHRSIMWT